MLIKQYIGIVFTEALWAIAVVGLNWMWTFQCLSQPSRTSPVEPRPVEPAQQNQPSRTTPHPTTICYHDGRQRIIKIKNIPSVFNIRLENVCWKRNRKRILLVDVAWCTSRPSVRYIYIYILYICSIYIYIRHMAWDSHVHYAWAERFSSGSQFSQFTLTDRWFDSFSPDALMRHFSLITHRQRDRYLRSHWLKRFRLNQCKA